TSVGPSAHPATIRPARMTDIENRVRRHFRGARKTGRTPLLRKRCRTRFSGITRNRSLLEPPLHGVEQSSSDVDAELPIQFTYSGRARDVDFRHELADHVEPREQDALRRERRP